MKQIINIIALTLFTFSLYAQGDGVIKGRIYNAKNNEPVPFANIVVWGTNIGSTSDLDGNFLFTGLAPGYVELRASAVGFETYISEQVLVTNANAVFLEVALNEVAEEIEEVVVRVSPFRKSEESPVSVQRIGVAEIEKNPGGNRDISKVIQSLPGVAPTSVERNDLIVRGGGPNENTYYLDGVEIPNINHFATQGASGGPVGILNVDFIREVNLYSSAFPANFDGALSSVLEFKQINGNKEKLKFKGSVGSSDLALTFDGPIGDKSTYVLSYRRSYLQFLFSALGLPFLPTYDDYQFKFRTQFNSKNELSIISLGALDRSVLNLEANETEYQRYLLGNLPENYQWNYTIGAVYKHFYDNGFDTWVLSRNYLNNEAYKYFNNNEIDSLKTFDYASAEIENKFRYEKYIRTSNDFKINMGVRLEYAKYENKTYRKAFINGAPSEIDYDSFLEIYKWGFFGQVSKRLVADKLILSAGFSADGNSYSSYMANPLNQISPRFSASYNLARSLFVNFNVGRYYQLPPYTTLGYKNSIGDFVNQTNDITYISADHIVGGIEFLPNENSTVSLEGFYKIYNNYPFSVNDSVSISSKSAGFGIFGDEEVVSEGKGRAYGLEVLYRNRDIIGFNLILSYTLVRSEFEDISGNYLPSAWDNRHILNVTATRSFKGNWDFGFKWRFVGGTPYTPYDYSTSELSSAWDAIGMAYLDYSQFNTMRLKPFHQLDIRVDKEFYFKKWSLNLYLDIQNLYNFKSDTEDILLREEQQVNGQSVPLPAYIDPVDGQEKYYLKTLESDGSGTVLPSIGIIVQF